MGNAANEAGELVHTIQLFNNGFKNIRKQIEEMTDEQLIELYNRAKELANVSWIIRCTVLGVAHSRAVKGDGTTVALAKEFGIGRRMSELDVKVYEIFVRNDPDFEPVLPAAFYQVATRAESPHEAIHYALEKRAEIPNYPIVAFIRAIGGKIEREPIEKGVYMLVKMEDTIKQLAEQANLDDFGSHELYGRIKLFTIAGYTYAEAS